MKVRELIAELQKLDQDAPVVYYEPGEEGWMGSDKEVASVSQTREWDEVTNGENGKVIEVRIA